MTQISDREWFCGFGRGEHDDPEQDIAAMLAVIEALDPPLRSAWAGCSLRAFDIAYDCRAEPFAVRQGLSAEILVRMAAVGATFGGYTLLCGGERVR